MWSAVMSEEQPIYQIVELAKKSATEQEDHALMALSRRVASHYAALRAGGVDRKVARYLTDNYQSHLLSIAVGPQVYPALSTEAGA